MASINPSNSLKTSIFSTEVTAAKAIGGIFGIGGGGNVKLFKIRQNLVFLQNMLR